jgi:dTDP-4-amino-4,6-dideoxygalactose transaminase
VLIPYNRANVTALEHEYVRSVLDSGQLRSGGVYTTRCQAWLANRLKRSTILLTNSATAALSMSFILGEISAGDEVIMPAFTFVSCANSVVLRGGVPVLVDVEPDTLNIDVDAVTAAITPRTRAIVPVHYAGITCDIVRLQAVARAHGLLLVEDAAQALLSTCQDQEAGTFGDFGVFSFHHTKNVSCGEGGALVINEPAHAERAHLVQQHGTDYTAFRNGRVPNYQWLDAGSAFMPSDLTAAFLLAQLERAVQITNERRAAWERYDRAFMPLDRCGVQRPALPAGARHNGHIYYLLLPKEVERAAFMTAMRQRGIETTSHYIPLDLTPGGRRYARAAGDLAVSHAAAERLVRLPLWAGIGALQDQVIEAVIAELGRCG